MLPGLQIQKLMCKVSEIYKIRIIFDPAQVILLVYLKVS